MMSALLLLRRYGLLLLAFTVIVTGVIGFTQVKRQCGPLAPNDFLDALYRTFQTFGLNFDLATCATADGMPNGPLNPWLQVSRYLAFLVAAWAVISVFFRSTWNDLLLWLQTRFRSENRLLLVGFGQINRAVALALKQGCSTLPITAVDRQFDAADRRLARDLGIRLIEAELSDPLTIDRIRPDRADRVIVALGDDIRTIEVASIIAPHVERGIVMREFKASDRTEGRPAGQTAQGEWPLAAHITDPALLANLTEARDLANRQEASFQPFNLRVEAACSFAYRADLVQRARDHGQERVHLVIVGLGHQGEAILIETLLTSYAHDLKPPRITVLDRNAAQVEARLRASYPRLMENHVAAIQGHESPACEGWVPITFHTLDVELTDFTRDDLLLAIDGPEVAEGPTAWLFSCGDDCRNQAAALQLEIAMQRRTRRAVPIFVRLWGAGLQMPLPGPRNLFGLIQYFGGAVETVQHSPLLSDAHEVLARAIHRAYQEVDKAPPASSPPEETAAVTPSTDRYRQDWLALPENMRASNRRPARHMGFKIRELGFDWRDFRKGYHPTLAKDHVRDLRARIAGVTDRARAARDAQEKGRPGPAVFTPQDDLLRCLAEVEHTVWSVERISNGWMPSPTGIRNNIYRHHIHLRPFADLPPMAQGYDLVSLDAGLARASCRDPCAAPRNVLRQRLNDPLPHDLSTVTQVELLIDPDTLPAESHLDASARSIHAWAGKKGGTATRLHLILTGPVVLPADRSRGHHESLAIRLLSAALADLPSDLVIDVTRRYPPLPLPSLHLLPDPSPDPVSVDAATVP
ncbi:NAD-binding protein [Paragemmobacter ruber]|uniref:RCK N-terminal domain-containing protein n=1 Tax=Paragemmobacter ruber TaxID=1985673 RepID=A0ABW9Y5D9_9RHOB|nr:NAD-binding protein [Rhodobacter ruber]NBE07761.1 hypothetical protein [Rhodobacter ruber]